MAEQSRTTRRHAGEVQQEVGIQSARWCLAAHHPGRARKEMVPQRVRNPGAQLLRPRWSSRLLQTGPGGPGRPRDPACWLPTLSTGTPAREEQHIMLRGFLGPPWRPRRLLSWSRCFSRASPDLSLGHRPQPPPDVSLNPRPFTPPGLQCPSDPSVHSRGPACVPCAPGAGRGSKTQPCLFRRPCGPAAEGPCNQRALERSVSGVRENGARQR